MVLCCLSTSSTAKLKNILTACETYFNQNEINTTVISTFGPKHSVLTDNIDCLLIDLPIIQVSTPEQFNC